MTYTTSAVLSTALAIIISSTL